MFIEMKDILSFYFKTIRINTLYIGAFAWMKARKSPLNNYADQGIKAKPREGKAMEHRNNTWQSQALRHAEI